MINVFGQKEFLPKDEQEIEPEQKENEPVEIPGEKNVFDTIRRELRLKRKYFQGGPILALGRDARPFAHYAKKHDYAARVDDLESSGKRWVDTFRETGVLLSEDERYSRVIVHGDYLELFTRTPEKPPNKWHIKRRLAELLRVAKKGGEIRIGPLGFGYFQYEKEMRKALEDALSDLSDEHIFTADIMKYNDRTADASAALREREDLKDKFLLRIRKGGAGEVPTEEIKEEEIEEEVEI